MKDGTVLHLVLEVHQNRILHELGLQETFLVDRAVKEALIAEIPEEICRIVLEEEVFGEVAREVCQLVTEQRHRLVGRVMIYRLPQFSMKQH